MGQLGWQHDRIREALRKREYIVDWRDEYLAGEDASQLDTLAAKLAARDVEVIIANGPASALAASRVTGRVPIVMALGTYPLESGLVIDLARPGGNVTGVTADTGPLVAKRLELLMELLPTVTRLAVFTNPTAPTSGFAWRDIQAAASALGLLVQQVHASSVVELDAAFSAAIGGGADAALMSEDEFFDYARQPILFHAERRRLPVIFSRREFVEEGGLISFGPEIEHSGHLAASLVDRILQGAPAGTLPLEVADYFEVAINLNAARSLGLSFPTSITTQATRIVPLFP
jgi:putative ABC transport system substrate-binding protein